MAALEQLSEEEEALWWILSDPTGVDQAEFLWRDDELSEDGCYRLWDFQWPWSHPESSYTIDQLARQLGKSISAGWDAMVHVFNHPGQDLLLTAPELSHLSPLIDKVKSIFDSYWLLDQMRTQKGNKGVKQSPHWEMTFLNGAKIVSRLPQRDGKGVKGQHPVKIVHDEVQDYPIAGYMELVETIKTHLDGAGWKMHGVSKGVGRDLHYQITQGKLSGDSDVSFQTLHYTAMHRPTWSDDERRRKIKQYGGDENHPDYVRNIYGLPSEAGSTIFVTARLMAAVDHEDVYNDEIYAYLQISGELIERTGEVERLLDLPLAHISERYTSFWGGMDVGFTHDPSEILIFGSERDAKRDRLLSRVRLERVTAGDQVRVVKALFAFYGEKLKRFGMDRTGNGLPLWHLLQEDRDIAERVAGYNFSEKRPVEIDETSDAPELEDRLIKRNIKDYGVDVLRTWVDDKKLVLPFDQELLGEWQGATAYIVKSSPTDDGPVRKYGGGDLHTLDAARMYAAAKNLLALETLLAQEPEQESVYEEFL